MRVGREGSQKPSAVLGHSRRTGNGQLHQQVSGQCALECSGPSQSRTLCVCATGAIGMLVTTPKGVIRACCFAVASCEQRLALSNPRKSGALEFPK